MNINNISLEIDNNQILQNISFKIPDNSFTCILGSNGSGKSSLMKILAGDIDSDSGSITDFDPNSITYLPQNIEPPLFLKVMDIIKVGFHQRKISNQEQAAEIEYLINQLKIEKIEKQLLEKTSTGEQQKTWLAFALAQSKKLMLLDEPLSAVDIESRKVFFKLLNEYCAAGKTTITMVTHDTDLAREFCDYALVLENGEQVFEGPIKNLLIDD